jgi:uncharacterized protein (TIGR02147 family)
MDLYQFNQYREAIEALVANSKTKVLRGDLAKAAGCSSSWITRVLSESVQLTPEQLLGIATFFHLNELETDYLLGLLELERAATVLLKTRIHLKLDHLKKEGKSLHIPVKPASTLSESDSYKYYSSWMYAAIHVATMIQKFSVTELSEKFSVDSDSLLKILKDLEQMGLVLAQSGKWQATNQNLHISSASQMAKLGHINWRNRSIYHLQNPLSQGLHYSGPHCLSQKDVSIINEKLKDVLMECRQIIDDSPSETMAVLCLDWYQILK